MIIEKRSLKSETGETGKLKLSIPFGSWSEDLGGFRERILPGAFRRSLEGSEDIVALWSHDTSKPLARRSNGTLKLSADQSALSAEITPDGTSWSEDARASIESGTVSGSSFAFRVTEGGDKFYRANGEWRRDLADVILIEVSPVVSPAYPASTAEAAQ